MPLVAVLLCLCSLHLWTAADDKVFIPQLTSKIEEFVDNLIQCRGVVGLTLAVVKGNETWTRGFGVADRASGRPVNSSTLFGIGSVTKAFTSTILGILMEESQGNYTWQTSVKDILGKEFQLADDLLTRNVTVKDILLHRTGLATSNIGLFAGFPSTFTRENLTSRLQYLPVAGQFRDEYNYNNWMYALAGRVAEVMGGASWEELLHTRIFQSLQMTDSRVIGYNVQVDADNFALPYAHLGDQVEFSDPVIYKISPAEPAGAIASSADDMAKWLSLHLKGGVTSDGHAILNGTTLQTTYTPQMMLSEKQLRRDYILRPAFPATFNTFGYGYAWFSSSYRGYSVVWHSGGLFSYTTYLMLLHDVGIGIFISTSSRGNVSVASTLQEVFFYTADLLLGEDPWLNVTSACQYPGPWHNTTSQTASNDANIAPGELENPQVFVGEYENKLFGDIVVTQNGSSELLVKYNRIAGRLHRTTERHVLMMEILGPLEILTRAEASVLYINMTFTRPDQSGKYQDLLLSAPALQETDVLVYQRRVKFLDPSAEKPSNSAVTSVMFGCVLAIHTVLVHILLIKCT